VARPKPAEDPALAKLVDELGELDQAITPDIKAKIARAEIVRKAIRQHYDDKQADAYFTAAGERFTATIGPRAHEKRINIPALAKKAGAIVFARMASVTLKALESEAPHLYSDVVTIAATGSRTLTVVRKAAA